MSQAEALVGFVAKWRARWPEWNIAQVFMPAAQRETADAWFALLQELTDAAWGGSDPTPGLAKLAWWLEELRGWSKGARRHPLGDALQRLPAPWTALAASLMALQQSRERPENAETAIAAMGPFVESVAECELALFGTSPETSVDAMATIESSLFGQRLLADPDAAVPLDISGAAADPSVSAHAWAERLLTNWRQVATRPRRLQAAFVRARLVHFAATGRHEPLAPWRALLVAWQAARKA